MPSSLEKTPVDPAISQIASAVFGHGSVLFILITVVTGFILVLAGNTAFNGFPTLASVLSRDSFLPHQMVRRGDRLSYSNGIVVLTVAAIALIVGFQAQTTRLIQLYVVGVFISFTLSQLGMIKHWNRQLRTRQSGQERMSVLRSRAVNIVGFMMTGAVLLIVLATKFTHGAWITLLMIAVAFCGQISIHRHYKTVREQLRVDDWHARRALPTRVRALVLVSSLSRPAMRAIAAARASSPTSIELVSVVADDEEENRMLRQWRASGVPVPLTLLSAPYRDIASVILQYVRSRRRAMPTEMLVVYCPSSSSPTGGRTWFTTSPVCACGPLSWTCPAWLLRSCPGSWARTTSWRGASVVNDPFLRVGAPTSSESNVHADEQPANAHSTAEGTS